MCSSTTTTTHAPQSQGPIRVQILFDCEVEPTAQAPANADRPGRASPLGAVFVALIAFAVGLLVVGGTLAARTIRSREVASLGAIPPEFPVVAIQRSGIRAVCWVVFYGDLASAGREEAGLSFVVDDLEVSTCKEQIAAQREIVSNGPAGTLPLWSAFVTFSPVSADGRQDVEVSATWDDDWINRGWYVANAEGVKPLRYQGFGAGGVLVALSKGVASGVALALIATVLFVRRTKRNGEA